MSNTQIADANGVGRKDVYTKVTERIISDLEQGIRPWMKPWSGDHAAGRITRPLRHNGTPYRGMNILLLWGEAMAKGYAAPIMHVAGGHHLQARTQAEAVDPGDDRHRQVAQHLAHAMDQSQEVARLRRIERAELVQVGAADEGAVALAGDDQHTQVRIVRQSGPRPR